MSQSVSTQLQLHFEEEEWVVETTNPLWGEGGGYFLEQQVQNTKHVPDSESGTLNLFCLFLFLDPGGLRMKMEMKSINLIILGFKQA